LAYALQAQRESHPPQQRPPGLRLGRPPARGSARQSGRKLPTKESPMFESVIDSGCVWHSHPRRGGLFNVRPYDDRIARRHRRRSRPLGYLHRHLTSLGLRLGRRAEVYSDC
jgi:hypothetical protein